MVTTEQRKGYKMDSVEREFTITKDEKKYNASVTIKFDDAEAERKYAVRGYVVELQRWLRAKSHRDLAKWCADHQTISIGMDTGSGLDEDTKAMVNLAKSSGLSVAELQQLIEQAKKK
jgi:ABC-type microcin C transport system duplicated ATPase subunit YejF